MNTGDVITCLLLYGLYLVIKSGGRAVYWRRERRRARGPTASYVIGRRRV